MQTRTSLRREWFVNLLTILVSISGMLSGGYLLADISSSYTVDGVMFHHGCYESEDSAVSTGAVGRGFSVLKSASGLSDSLSLESSGPVIIDRSLRNYIDDHDAGRVDCVFDKPYDRGSVMHSRLSGIMNGGGIYSKRSDDLLITEINGSGMASVSMFANNSSERTFLSGNFSGYEKSSFFG